MNRPSWYQDLRKSFLKEATEILAKKLSRTSNILSQLRYYVPKKTLKSIL